ncbi:hypothetical protein CN141_26595, partial [Sinorhizobium meliloti]
IERPPRSSWRICANARSALLFTRQCCTWIRFSRTRTPLVVSLLSSICQHPGGHVLSGQEADWPRSGAIRCLQIG